MKDFKAIAQETVKHIKRDTTWFDLETTGVDTNLDEIVQFAGLRINVDGTHEYFETLIKPNKAIPEAASDVHKITNEMVKNEKPFKAHAAKIAKFVSNCDVGGFNNARFDVVLLDRQLRECGFNKTMSSAYIVDSYLKFIADCTRKLGDSYKFYTGKELVGAHDAGVDILATVEVFVEQAKRSGKDAQEISKESLPGPDERVGFSNHIKFTEDGVAVWGFGKNKDKPITQDQGYVRWVLSSDFPVEVKDFLSQNA